MVRVASSAPSRVEETSVQRQIAKDTLVYLPGRIVPAAIALVAVPILTACFAAKDMGRYDLTVRLVAFLSTFGALWLSTTVMRFYPSYEQRGRLDVFGRAVAAARAWALVAGLAILAVIWALGPDRLFASYRGLMAVAACVFVSQGLFESGLAMARAKNDPARFSIASVVNAVAKLPLGIGLALYVAHDISGMLWGTAFVTFVVYAVMMRRDFASPPLRLDAPEKAAMREMLAYGMPIALSLTLNFFLGNSDRFFLKYYRSDAEVGAFSVVTMLIDQPMSLVFQTLMLAVFPTVAASFETEGREATEQLIGRMTRVYFLLALPACVLLASLAYPIMHIVAQREEFRQAYTVGPWLAFASLAYGLHYYASLGLHLARKTGQLLIATLASIAINIGGNWLLVPAHGYDACGAVRLISNATLVIAVAAMASRYIHWSLPWKSVLRTAAAAAITGAFLYAASTRLPVNLATLSALLATGALVYGALLMLFRELGWNELWSLVPWQGRPK